MDYSDITNLRNYEFFQLCSSERMLSESWYNFTHDAVERQATNMSLWQEVQSILFDEPMLEGETLAEYKLRMQDIARSTVANSILLGAIEGNHIKSQSQEWFDSLEVTAKGSFNRGSLVQGVANAIAEAKYRNDLPDDDPNHQDIVDATLTIDATSLEGALITLDDFNSMANSSFHSIVCELGAATAYLKSAANSAVDRITLARDTVASYFKDRFTDYSSSLNSVIARIRSIPKPKDYISTLWQTSGLADITYTPIWKSAEATYTGSSPACAYAAQCIKDAACNSLAVLGAAVGAVFYGLVTAGKYAVSKAITAIRRTFVDPHDLVEQDPDGCPTTSEFAGSHSFVWYSANRYRSTSDFNKNSLWFNLGYYRTCYKLTGGRLHFDFIPSEVIYEPAEKLTGLSPAQSEFTLPRTNDGSASYFQYDGTIAKVPWRKRNLLFALFLATGQAYTRREYQDDAVPSDNQLFVTLFGGDTRESLFMNVLAAFAPLYPDTDFPSDLDLAIYMVMKAFTRIGVAPVFTTHIKFKCLNTKYRYMFTNAVSNSFPQTATPYTMTLGALKNVMLTLAQAPDAYAEVSDDAANEVECYNGFIFAQKLSSAMFAAMRLYIEEESYVPLENNHYIAFFSYRDSADDSFWKVASITRSNKCYPVPAASTDTVTNANFISASTGFRYNTVASDRTDVYSDGFWDFSDVQFLPSVLAVAGNDTYIPYIKGAVDWYDSKYYIKSDAANAQAFAIAMTVVALAAIVAVVAISATVILRKLYRTAMVKSEAMRYKLEDAIKDGSVTKKDWKVWRKAARKEKILGKLSGNIISSSPESGDSVLSNVVGSLGGLSESINSSFSDVATEQQGEDIIEAISSTATQESVSEVVKLISGSN